ncbi:flagellar hook-basal body complex protein FliE [Cedecea sp.]|jgi:flagellar hook-basal body complex protein FliE|uniref:flagellar hook-basal body complex protein FliE n=1 Tax=Cedecea sp. TaxID=1970739 RepID=UPI0012AE7EE9|nr:flagellar hook-basal body complex protein FliE [Enterobacteriaceae bacterium RIT693]
MSAAIHGVLEKIHAQAQAISGSTNVFPHNAVKNESKGASFSDALLNSINEINKTQQTSKQQTQDWMSGKSDIGLNDVMLSMQKSSVAFTFGVQLRNKMVSAYQEIMSTPV